MPMTELRQAVAHAMSAVVAGRNSRPPHTLNATNSCCYLFNYQSEGFFDAWA
jgi:hypothetical protein